uniref:Uncharacterized protein n=1 Tax=Rhizophora mucronata TaxID=61149 RepID=A0A2P2PRY7_RHIMU
MKSYPNRIRIQSLIVKD